ncbi:phage tail protein [Marinovum sp.]|uniref:phage tail protein n=1 Tax=Marinovum sp. TaxID=2024839 RepID=UPI002B27C21E|nr:tail fiber protein [Marinovum sp.]
MAEPFIGQIYLVGYTFAQRGFALCNGQLVAISQNTALFSLLGTIYGGDGRTTFGLPDLRGRAPIGFGQGPGLDDYRIGERGGSETTTLLTSQIPSHAHTATMHAELGAPNQSNPQGNLMGLTNIYLEPTPAPNRTLAAESIVVQNTGGGQPFNNLPPYIAMNYEIALTGIFPSRS